MRAIIFVTAIAAVTWSAGAMSDQAEARCDIYPSDSDHSDRTIRCTFAQRQGHVTIAREDGVEHELSPTGDTPGEFLDQQGRTVLRQAGLADQGIIFRFPDEAVYVYWSTAALDHDDKDNVTSPFSTDDFDATALLRCRSADDSEFSTCPAGILRMGGGQASIVVLSPDGERFTINFMTGYINATNRESDARLVDDTWLVTINSAEVYEVPLAAVEGG